MATKKQLVEDFEQRIKAGLISQNTLARAIGVSDVVFTRKLKKYGGACFTPEEAKVMEKILKVKLTEPITE